MPKKPTKSVDPRATPKAAGRRALGIDAPRTKPLKRIRDAKPPKARKK